MAAQPFHIDPDMRKARTPPPSFYTDPESFVWARECVFPRAWHVPVDGLDPVAAGEARPITLLPGFLDEPLALVRDDDGVMRCLSNVCTHRANLVITEAGRCHALRCGYHGRRFAQDGRCVGAPGFDGEPGFPGAEDDLARASLAEWGGLRFVSLDPEAPFADLLGPVDELLAFAGLDAARLDAGGIVHHEVAANWALYVDNYLEGFHVPFVHPELQRTLAGYRVEPFGGGVLQVGLAADGELAFDLPDGHPYAGERVAAFYVWLFPATMLNVYPWGLSLNVVTPLGPARTRVSFVPFVQRPELRERGAGAGLDRTEGQDEAVVEWVQRGVRARLARRGRYAPDHERGVHHFHRLLAGRLD